MRRQREPELPLFEQRTGHDVAGAPEPALEPAGLVDVLDRTVRHLDRTDELLEAAQRELGALRRERDALVAELEAVKGPGYWSQVSRWFEGGPHA